MGLFDKKKKSDDFDSPVEEINLAARSGPVAKPAAPAPATTNPAGTVREIDAEPPPDFGINKAIELMRQLPGDNAELVVTVVKTTLEALHIKIPTIIADAERKLRTIEGRVDSLKKEIGEYEREIAQRKSQISALEADHAETSTVKERLGLAEKLGAKQASAVKAP